MTDTVSGSSSFGRGRKRKRQVSWAAAELLEEVKVFHMAKPVNPSVPPPAVDDGGEGGQNSASASGQPGLALLGLLGVGASSSSSSSPSSNTPAASSTPSSNGANAAQQSSGSATASGAAQEGPAGGWNGASSRSFGAEGGGSGARGDGSGRVGGVGSRLFKGFQTTETVVRRKKPSPVTTSALPAETPSASPTMYPKDVWPGHKPPSQKADGSHKGKEGGDGKAGGDDELMEFFCDGCDVTIPNGVERMECVACPDEFCLCQACYDAGELLDKKHEHELLPSSAPFHITSAAPNAEAAAAAAQALHVTEEARNDKGGELDGGYDDEDLG